MAKCPKCGEEISSLTYWGSVEERYNATIDKDECMEYNLENRTSTDEYSEYECPECQHVIFTCEKDAVNFLKNKGA